jgi:hypothetical protein
VLRLGVPVLTSSVGFAARTHEEQVKLAQQYAGTQGKTAQAAFITAHATRWFEFARLPYFDVCRMIIIDPMHNLLLGMDIPLDNRMACSSRLLGLVKTHWYNIWIQLKVLRPTKELARFHDILSRVRCIEKCVTWSDPPQLLIPTYLGRVPALMGEPAGGSLTADQWMISALAVCPVAVRHSSSKA